VRRGIDYAVRSQGGDEVGGDVQNAPVQAGVAWYKCCRLFCPLSVSVSVFLFLTLVSLNQQSLRQPDRGTCSESVERCNAGQSSTGVKVKSLFLSSSLVGAT
jgi:hypothetical protein